MASQTAKVKVDILRTMRSICQDENETSRADNFKDWTHQTQDVLYYRQATGTENWTAVIPLYMASNL